MEKKKRKGLTISELDVEPISDEELAAIAGTAAEVGGVSYCECITVRTDFWWCDLES